MDRALIDRIAIAADFRGAVAGGELERLLIACAEECAKVCDQEARGEWGLASHCADAIRSKFSKG